MLNSSTYSNLEEEEQEFVQSQLSANRSAQRSSQKKLKNSALQNSFKHPPPPLIYNPAAEMAYQSNPTGVARSQRIANNTFQ